MCGAGRAGRGGLGGHVSRAAIQAGSLGLKMLDPGSAGGCPPLLRRCCGVVAALLPHYCGVIAVLLRCYCSVIAATPAAAPVVMLRRECSSTAVQCGVIAVLLQLSRQLPPLCCSVDAA